MTTIYIHGQTLYCWSLQRKVTFLRYDSAGLSMVVDEDGGQHTCRDEDLQDYQRYVQQVTA